MVADGGGGSGWGGRRRRPRRWGGDLAGERGTGTVEVDSSQIW